MLLTNPWRPHTRERMSHSLCLSRILPLCVFYPERVCIERHKRGEGREIFDGVASTRLTMVCLRYYYTAVGVCAIHIRLVIPTACVAAAA